MLEKKKGEDSFIIRKNGRSEKVGDCQLLEISVHTTLLCLLAFFKKWSATLQYYITVECTREM